MVRRRHRAEGGQVRPRARQPARGSGRHAPDRRRPPAAAPLPRRARVRVLGPPRGRRHDRPARAHRPLARRAAGALGRRSWPRSPPRTRCGTAAAGPASSRAMPIPIASRVAQLAEFVEVAYRTGGIEAATTMARQRSGGQFDPALAARLCADAGEIFDGLDTLQTWDAVIAAEPALAVVLSGERFDAALLAIANFIDLKSPYTLGHSRAVAELAAEAASQLALERGRDPHGAPRRPRARLRPPRRVERDLGQAGPARCRRVGARAHASLRDRAHAAPVRGPRPARPHRRPAPRAPRRLRLPARPRGPRDLAARADHRRRRRLPGDARAAPASPGAQRRRGGHPAARRRARRPPRRGGRASRC